MWNAWFRSNGRKFIYDFATISELLRVAGFEHIARTAAQEAEWAADEYRSVGADGLLVVEAMRPAAGSLAAVARAPYGPWRRRLARNPVLREAVFQTRKIVRRLAFAISNRAYVRHHMRQHPRKLHIAAGTAVLDGWLNTDLYARPGVAYLDLTEPFPFPNATFDYVFSEHHFTNFRPETALKMFREVWRVLKPTGVLRVATPHLEFLRELCVPQKTELQQRYIEWACKTFCPDIGVCNHAVVVNNFAHNWGNQFIYDVPAVISLMTRAGFDRFVRCEVGQSEDPELRHLEFHGKVIGEEFNRLETIVLEVRRGAQPPRVDK
jgi:predicted SAM-dependent methyltransferase